MLACGRAPPRLGVLLVAGGGGRSLPLAPPPGGLVGRPVGEAVDAFLAALEAAGASASTLRAYRAALRSFVEYVGESRPAGGLGVSEYVGWLRWLRGRGPRRPRGGGWEATVHYYSVYVRRFLEWLGVARGLPAAPRPRRGFSGALRWGEVEALLEASRDLLDALIVAFLAESGLRARELLGLRVGDVDLEAGEALVRGKYGKERRVPLGPLTRAVLRLWIRERRLGPGDRLVPISYQALYKRLKTLAARAGVDPSRVRPHVLRHTFATEALRRGVSLAALQRLLGHSDVKVTQLYLHLAWEDVRREYERAFAPPGGQPGYYHPQQPPPGAGWGQQAYPPPPQQLAAPYPQAPAYPYPQPGVPPWPPQARAGRARGEARI